MFIILMAELFVKQIILSIWLMLVGHHKLMDCSLMPWINLYWRLAHLVLHLITWLLFLMLLKAYLSLTPAKSHISLLLLKPTESFNTILDQELPKNSTSTMPLKFLVELITVPIMTIFMLLPFLMTSLKLLFMMPSQETEKNKSLPNSVSLKVMQMEMDF